MQIPGKNFIGTTVFGLIFNKKRQILLIQNEKYSKLYKRYENKWCMIGGKVKFGEKIINALKREIKEETNLDVYDIKFINYNEHIENGWHWVTLNFQTKTKSDKFNNEEPRINKKMKWFELRNIPVNISDYTKKCLEDLKLKI